MKCGRYPAPEGFEPLKNYEGIYSINTKGDVWTHKTGRILKPRRKQYLTVVLYDYDGQSKECTVHRLVAEQFIPNPDNLPDVNHKDEDKYNPEVTNLEWCSKSYNKVYSVGKAVVALKDGIEVQRWPSIRVAARELGGPGDHGSNIWSCCNLKHSKRTCYGYQWMYADDYDKQKGVSK